MSFSVRTSVLACIVSVCLGYPTLFINAPNSNFAGPQPLTKPTCTQHPSANYGPHGAPVTDTTSKLELTPQTTLSNAKAGTLCLGKSYDIKVIYGESSSRQSLLTTSAGMLQPSLLSLNDAACAGKRFIPRTEPPSKTLNFTTALFIPCNTTDKALTLGMTSIQTKSGAFQTLLSNYTIEACGEATCTEVAPKWPQSLTLAAPAGTPAAAPAPKSTAAPLKGASSLVAVLLSAAAAVLAV